MAEDYKLGEGEDEESRDFRRERELETASRNAANDVKNKLWELHFHDYGRGVAIFRTSKLQELVIKGRAINCFTNDVIEILLRIPFCNQ